MMFAQVIGPRYDERLSSDCESPLEARLLDALINHPLFIGHGEIMPPWFSAQGYVAPAETVCMLIPQAEILEYRVDFLIVARGWRAGLDATVIEVDGHIWHEKTKAQARHDKQRDRRMTKAGYRLLRYTGTEIHWDVQSCADEIWTTIAAATGWRHEGNI